MRHHRGAGLRAAVILILMLVVGPPQVLAAALGQREVLPNGMVLLFSEKRAVPILTVTMLIQAGAIQDPPDKPGVANLTAELITQGTTARTATQISEAIEFVGGSLSLGAGQDVATVSLSVLSRDLDLGLELLADILLNPTFAPDEIKRKAQEVLAGIQRKQEDPGEVAGEAFAALVFGPHPYGRPVEGTETSVPTITREDLVRFHQTNYRPNKTILAVVGDVSLSDLKRRLEARLGGWQPGGPAFTPPPDPAPLTRPVVRTIQRDVTQANILLGHLGVTRDNPDYYAIQVMNYILGGGGFASRILDKIRDDMGLAYSAYSYFNANKLDGGYTVGMETKNASAKVAIDETLKIIERMRQEPVTDKELQDAKDFITGSFPRKMDTNAKIAELLAQVEFFNLGLNYFEVYEREILKVTKDDMLAAAKKYLHPDNINIVVVAKQEEAGLK